MVVKLATLWWKVVQKYLGSFEMGAGEEQSRSDGNIT